MTTKKEQKDIVEKFCWGVLGELPQLKKSPPKPCKALGYCPYGVLIEALPLKEKRTSTSCTFWGHECPASYQGVIHPGITG